MTSRSLLLTWLALVMLLLAPGCGSLQTVQGSAASGTLPVMATTSILGDIAQNVAGDRAKIQILVPLGTDPHEYQPAPRDLARLSDSSVLITNGAGYESWLEKSLANLDGKRVVVEASKGLAGHTHQAGEAANPDKEIDPHFWLDPNLAIHYVENIRDGLSAADPQGASTYRDNASAYTAKLKELDAWIRSQVEQVPAQSRMLVTNHESLGYYADRYGFQIVGTIIPSVSTEASPSAQQVAHLVEAIHASGAPAIFLETGTNPQIAEQIARETGVKVITNLYTESLTPADGQAPDYIALLRHDTQAIVEALKP